MASNSSQPEVSEQQPIGQEVPLSQEALLEQEKRFAEFTGRPTFIVYKVSSIEGAKKLKEEVLRHRNFLAEDWEQWKQGISGSEPTETYKTLYGKAARLYFLSCAYVKGGLEKGIHRPNKKRLLTIADTFPISCIENRRTEVRDGNATFIVALADFCRGLGLSEDVLKVIEAEVKMENIDKDHPKFAEFDAYWKKEMSTPLAEKDVQSPK